MLSGTYTGTAGPFGLVLRVDIDGPDPLNKISGDLYEAADDGPIYVNSFLVDKPQVESAAGRTLIRGAADLADSTPWAHQVEIEISHPESPQAPPPQAHVAWLAAGWGGLEFFASYSGPSFRSVTIDTAFEEGVSPDLAYSTHLSPDRPAELPDKLLTVPLAYAEAGIQALDGTAAILLQNWEAGLDQRWTDSELHAAIENHFAEFRNEPQWRLFLLFVKRHMQPGYLGLMFDLQDMVQRQACALFTEHSYLSAGEEAVRKRAYLWAALHETAHCFNLLHSFDKGKQQESHADDLSWMNYPYYYDRLPGKKEGDFWKRFSFAFTQRELLHLRHAPLLAVIMGGLPFQSGAAAELPEATFETAPSELDPTDVFLRLESKSVFEFGEAVFLELSLRPPQQESKQARTIDLDLDPANGYVELVIQQPSGRTVRFRPVVRHDVSPPEREFTPNDTPAYDSIYCGFGQGGYYIAEPGHYRVRAVLRRVNSPDLLSNLLELDVAPPFHGEEAAIVDLLLGPEQGMLFALSGSDVLSRGNAALHEYLLRSPRPTLAAHAHRVLGLNASRDFKHVVPGRARLRVRPAHPEAAISHLSACLEQGPPVRHGIDNITFGETAACLVQMQVEAGRQQEAQRTVAAAMLMYAKQGLRQDVLERIDQKLSRAVAQEEEEPETRPRQAPARRRRKRS